jgi:hypothetical protein
VARNLAGDVFVHLHELKYLPADRDEAFDCFQAFCGIFLGVVDHDMCLDFIGTKLQERAEWASASRRMHVLYVSVKILRVPCRR